MRLSPVLPALLSVALLQAAPASAAEGAIASAEVKACAGIDKHAPTGEADAFKVAHGTRIHAWVRVQGEAGQAAEGTEVFVAFSRDGKEVFRQALAVPHVPYRTHAYRTFRKGDEGAWTAQVLDAAGKVLGKTDFKVAFE